jgi:hypothetical protein
VLDRARLEKLHERVLEGDPKASAETFTMLHRPIASSVRRRLGGRVSWEEATDAATDAIVAYVKSPDRYDAARAGLLGYLTLVAYRDALNLLRDRRAEQEKHMRSVELSTSGGKDQGEAANAKLDADRILRDFSEKIIVDDGDEQVLRLFLEGERDTAAYAVRLGIAHLPEAEQRKIVKQRRDRIDQRLQRLKEVLK